MAAPTSSVGTPAMLRPSKFVSSTTTSSGTRKMRLIVSAFGRFITCVAHDNIGGCDEGDSARRGQGHAAPSTHHPHAETDRSDLRSPLLTISARSHKESL